MLNTVVFFSSASNRPMTRRLAIFVERSCRFVEKDPAWLVQEEPREGEALLLAERKLLVPAFHPVELDYEIAEIAPLEPLIGRLAGVDRATD